MMMISAERREGEARSSDSAGLAILSSLYDKSVHVSIGPGQIGNTRPGCPGTARTMSSSRYLPLHRTTREFVSMPHINLVLHLHTTHSIVQSTRDGKRQSGPLLEYYSDDMSDLNITPCSKDMPALHECVRFCNSDAKIKTVRAAQKPPPS
jgi:hypothetical protein